MSKRGSGSSARAGGGMARLEGTQEDVAKAKEIRQIANKAIDELIVSVKNTEKIFGKELTEEAIERQEEIRKEINRADTVELISELGGIKNHPGGAVNYLNEVQVSKIGTLGKKMDAAYWRKYNAKR